MRSNRPVAPTLVFVHGVGMWPGLFDRIGALLDPPSISVIRPGYDDGHVPADLDEGVDALATLVRTNGNAVVVGVSGGATLALALALRAVPGLVGIVTHEPLIGPLEPELHERVAGAARHLADSPGRAPAIAFCRSLYGADTWDALPVPAHRWAARHHGVICAEVAHFAGFAPDPAALEALQIPHLTTLGAASPPARRRTADFLATRGARPVVVDGADHLVHVQAPEAFADAIAGFGPVARPHQECTS